jgi:RNA polymerase sigma-70 factor (ECF subfamily)
MSTAPGSDQDAVDMERLRGGQDTALNDLMSRHGERLFHYLIRILQNEEDAADAAQETFVRVYQHRDRFDRRQKFSAWLYAIASNLARDRFRWRKRHPVASLDADRDSTGGALADVLPGHKPSPSQAMEASERADAVRAAVAELHEDLRVPLVLAEFEGRSQADIASVLSCSVKAVEMRLYRARQQLRQTLGALFNKL